MKKETKIKSSERSFQQLLYKKFIKRHNYLAANIFLFNWESDFISVTKAGYIHEYEIKITKSDFKNEELNKKEKLQILIEGKIPTIQTWEKKEYGEFRTYTRPNYFWYVVPKGLLTIEEIKDYCGLMYINTEERYKKIEVIREAKTIHKTKISDNQVKKILESSYWKYWRLWNEDSRRKNENSRT